MPSQALQVGLSTLPARRLHSAPLTMKTGLTILTILLSCIVCRAELKRDIEYGQAGGERLLLDVNVPDGTGPFPVAILVHGGGWSGGDKSGTDKPGSSADITPWFGPLTAANFTWFSINYRMAPKNRWPACFEDVQTAIRWVKAHAAEFKGDPKRIAIFGHSAGGQLALLAGVQADESTRLQAVVGYAPVTDPEQELPERGGISSALQNLHGIGKDITPEALKILREMAPINHIKPGSGLPPFLILHGDADKTVPLQQSLNFQSRLRASGFSCDVFIIPGATHRLTERGKTSTDHDQRMIAWLNNTLDTAATRSAANAIVAADGSGQFKTVQEAINAAPQTTSREKPWVIQVKPGVYPEVVYVQREKRFVHLVGEDATTTRITAALSAKMIGPDGKPIGTFRTATVQIDADDFSAEKITFENAAGPVGQALAVRVDGDRVTFRDCRFLGWQDTILTNRGRHYFKRCLITGATDFIFGGATAYFEDCVIICDGNGYITAASTPREQTHGFVFSHCRISGSKPEIRTYLGRPWRDFAMVVFMNTEMSDVVRPEAWHNWDKPERETTTRYFEFASTGTGAAHDKRVKWAHVLSEADAAGLTPKSVLGGSDGWDPDTLR